MKPLSALLAALLLLGGAAAAEAPGPSPQEQKQTGSAEQKTEKQAKITEEIQVVGKAPREQPVATVTRIEATKIEENKPLDLSEIIRYAPGVNVTWGNKMEFTLKLRGMDSRRIALLIDGVPSYEPYYGSFDLKTISAEGLDSLQVTKGPSSVLYGPNTLAGIVNVVTRRPQGEPFLTARASGGTRRTYSTSLDGGLEIGAFAFAGGASLQRSDGFAYPDPASGDEVYWRNSNYRRLNLNGKAYYSPSSETEIMVNAGYYSSEYGMPAAIGVQKPRYWHFKNWDRFTLNAGGFTSLGGGSTLRFRAFSVNYKNTLDQYKDAAMRIRQFESTFDNSVYGAFALADLALSEANTFKLSLNYQKDIARTQDDVGLPFTRYDQGTFSAAAEDHLALSRQWKLIGGLSLDVIDKFTGGTASRINPLFGIKFTPADDLDLHLSVAQKSRLPNMRALYSSTNGNPDLLSETGTNAEIGVNWSGPVTLAASAFVYRFKNMIDTLTLADGTKKYWNVGRARIDGIEVQAGRSFGMIEGTINYTWLDHRNETSDRPLDALSPHTLSFDLTGRPSEGLRLSLYGLFGSASSWFDATENTVLRIPAYFSLDAVAAYGTGRTEVFIKATNIFNAYIYSEPVFPWRARFFEAGAKIRVF